MQLETLGSIVMRAADARPDVRRCDVLVLPAGKLEIMLRVDRDHPKLPPPPNSASLTVVASRDELEDGRTLGAILEGWLGPEPAGWRKGRSQRLLDQHDQLHARTPNEQFQETMRKYKGG